MADASNARGPLQRGLTAWARASRGFKLRVAVVALWAVASVASVAFAFGGGEENPLDARVNMVDTGFGTALDIQNHGEAVWKDVTVTLEPGGWTYRRSTVRPGERIAAQTVDFARPSEKGAPEHAPRDYHPTRLRIRTADAVYQTDPGRKR